MGKWGIAVGAFWLGCLVLVGSAQEPGGTESALVKLLKSGRVPEDRQGTIVEMIGRRGEAADLRYLFDQVVPVDGFAPRVRLRALAALAEAALTRQARPSGNVDALASLMAEGAGLDPEARRLAVRLAGLWKVESLVGPLRSLAGAKETSDALRAEALEALAAIGNAEARAAIDALAASEQPPTIRARALAALAGLDPDAAAPAAAALLREAAAGVDLQPLLAGFLRRQDGAGKLAAALEGVSLSPDAAKLGLRALYALGRADAALVTALSQAAGLDTEVRPLDPAEMDALLEAVREQGDPARGEDLFRRPDLNCANCHAIGGAGGGVGPELSPIGQNSPVDYLVHSILLPDQAIKEEFQTRVVLTTDGRIFQGIVVDRDEQRMVLKDATGALVTVPTSAIEDSKEGGSLMPKGLANLMTRAELVDLVRFLSELGKPGRYAIPSSPVIVRWRVLKPVSEDLVRETPEDDLFRAQVLDAPEGSWLPLYAKVGGRLPLDEASAIAESPVVYLKGEVEVSEAGAVAFRIDRPEGVAAWIDDQPMTWTSPGSFATELTVGRHPVVLRVDTRQRPNASELVVELSKPAGSSAEFTVVGGR